MERSLGESAKASVVPDFLKSSTAPCSKSGGTRWTVCFVAVMVAVVGVLVVQSGVFRMIQGVMNDEEGSDRRA